MNADPNARNRDFSLVDEHAEKIHQHAKTLMERDRGFADSPTVSPHFHALRQEAQALQLDLRNNNLPDAYRRAQTVSREGAHIKDAYAEKFGPEHTVAHSAESLSQRSNILPAAIKDLDQVYGEHQGQGQGDGDNKPRKAPEQATTLFSLGNAHRDQQRGQGQGEGEGQADAQGQAGQSSGTNKPREQAASKDARHYPDTPLGHAAKRTYGDYSPEDSKRTTDFINNNLGERGVAAPADPDDYKASSRLQAGAREKQRQLQGEAAEKRPSLMGSLGWKKEQDPEKRSEMKAAARKERGQRALAKLREQRQEQGQGQDQGQAQHRPGPRPGM